MTRNVHFTSFVVKMNIYGHVGAIKIHVTCSYGVSLKKQYKFSTEQKNGAQNLYSVNNYYKKNVT